MGVVLLGLIATGRVVAGSSAEAFQEKKFDELSSTAMSDWGRLALEIQRPKWKHGETEHFILHFFRNGEKTARRSELFYDEIKEFFGNRLDLLGVQKPV